jgi:hypothetical protein
MSLCSEFDLVMYNERCAGVVIKYESDSLTFKVTSRRINFAFANQSLYDFKNRIRHLSMIVIDIRT